MTDTISKPGDQAKKDFYTEPKGCAECELIRTKYKGFGPSHNGSRFCESGSIASGGDRAHCTCDTCF